MQRGSKRRRNGNGGSRKKQRSAPSRSRKRNPRTAGFLGIEKKFYETSLVGASLTNPTDWSGCEHNPSATICLNSVAQNDTEQGRDGRKMMMKNISVTGVLYQAAQVNQTALDTNPVVQIALVLDQQTNGALLSSENVYVNQGGDAILAASPFRNLQYITRFKVLRALQVELPQPMVVWDGTNVEQGGTASSFRFDVQLEIPVTFSGTTSTIANIIDNSLSIIAGTTSTGTAVTLSYNARLRFVG